MVSKIGHEMSQPTAVADPILGVMDEANRLPSDSIAARALIRLAKEVMGWHTFEDTDAESVVNVEDIEAHAPCALQDQQFPVLLHYAKVEPIQAGGVRESSVYGRHWNPLGEIHDAWEVLEACQQRLGFAVIIDPGVFAANAATAARTISMTVLSALDERKKVLV